MTSSASRKHLRVAWRLPCTLEDRDTGSVTPATTYDLSVGGALVFVGTALPDDTRVVVRLAPRTRHGTKDLVLQGRVVRSLREDEGVFAIAFDALRATALEDLRESVFTRSWSQAQAIGEFPAFWALGDLELLTLASVCHEQTLGPGSSLSHEGDTQRCAFLVRSGSVQLRSAIRGPSDGYEILGAGSVFGESAVLLDSVHGLDVVALEMSHLIVVPRAALLHLREQDPRLALLLCEVFAREVAQRAARSLIRSPA